MELDRLLERFGDHGPVAVEAGENGLPKVRLTHRSGAATEVYLHGAHLTSWRTADGRERLFLSEKSRFESGIPIRGGIPVVFPQFGAGDLPQHGFARTRTWHLQSADVTSDDCVWAAFKLADNDQTRRLWPHRFAAELRVGLTDTLSVNLSVCNVGGKVFTFTAALHTYFAIKEIRAAAVEGLEGVSYINSLGGGDTQIEDRRRIRIDSETDRVYTDVPDECRVIDGADGSRIRIRKEHMNDVVLWNPWIAKSKRMGDFGDEEFRRMLCVETGNVRRIVTLEPGETWAGKTEYCLMG